MPWYPSNRELEIVFGVLDVVYAVVDLVEQVVAGLAFSFGQGAEGRLVVGCNGRCGGVRFLSD